MSEILHCPFCGFVKSEPVENNSKVKCWACGATGPDFNTSAETAIASWNRRALMSGTDVYRVALRIALKMCDAAGQKDEEKVAKLAIQIAYDMDQNPKIK